MKDSEGLSKSAEQLRKSHPYFKWPNMPALAGWLRHGSCCVYCKKDLMETWESLFGSAHTDHLLPRKYKELLDDDSNLVLGCAVCNSLKKNYDANLELPEHLRYISGSCLTDEQHLAVLNLCQQEVAKRRTIKQEFIVGAIFHWRRLNH